MAFRPAPENPPDSTRRPLTEELLQGNSSVSSSPQESPEASDASSSSPNSSPESEDFSPSFKLSSGTKLKAVAAKKTFLSLREAQAVLMKKMAGGKRDKLATALMKHIEKEKKRLSVGTSFSHQGNVTLHIDAPAVVCRLLCKNGGVCLLKDRCLCPSNFTGKFCQIPVTSQAMPSFTSPNEIVKPPRVSVAAPSTDLTRSEFLLPLRGQNQDLPGGAAGASLVKVRVQHPPEASVKVHQVMKVSGFMPAPQPLLSGALSGSAGAPAPVDSGVRTQTLGGERVYAQHIGFKYCFREVKDGQCSSPLPGLRSKEMCCRGLGKAWGSSDCTLCPPHKAGRNNSTCPVGFQPSNGTKCLDVDECLQPGLCENGLCVNTAGSYSCVCEPGYILDASHGLCISQSVISEEKGQCHRVLGSGLGPSSCSLPILRNITKQICCCSRVGKAWGPECQRCPYFGSAAFKEICPAGPGYHYSASVLQFSQRAADQLGTRGAQLVTNGDQRHHGTAFRGAGKSQQKPSSGRPSPPPPRLAVSPPPSRPAKPGSAAWHRPQTPDGAATQPTRPKPTAAPVRWPPRSNESQDTGRDQGTAGSQGTSQNQVTYRSQGTRQNQDIGRNRGSSQNHNTSGSQGSSQNLDRSWDQRTDGSQDTTKNQVTGHKQGTSRSQIPNRSQGTRLGQGISISQSSSAKEATKQSPGSGRSPVTDRNQVASDNRGTDGSQETSGGPSSTWNRGTSASQGLLPGRGDSLPEPAPRIPEQDSGPRGDLLKPQTTTRPPHVKLRGACESKPDACGGGRCVDQPGGKHSCVCHQGYKANAQRTHCQDVNECVASRGVCAPGECVNNAGSYRCVCPPGYKTDARKTSCQDVNECEDPLLCPGQECKNNPGSYRCVSCQPGFGLLNGLCTDIDECVQAPCTNGGCENTPGSFRCLCRHGYKLTNNTCADIDECADVSQCPGQICVNSVGSYRCVSCRPGYTLTNKQCTDVNECEDSSLCPGGQCVNTKGSYKCVDCRQGYRATNGVCEDVDECLNESACETERVCVNTVGSFRCNCLPGYRTFGRGRPCRDIDECLEENWCPPTGECVNTPGSFRCVCPQGYALDEGHDGNNRTCVDVNECARADVCADGECVNTEGSFACRCRRGFVSNPESNACLDADECASSGGSICGESERCENTIGSYRCLTSCEPGFRASADGRCHDVDECADGSACGRHAVCQNVAGTYVCVCDPGFTAAPDGNSCEDEDECASMPGVCGSARCDNLEGSFMCECDTPGEHFHAAARRCVSPLPPEAFDLRPSSSSSSFHAGAFELPAPRPGELRECYYDVSSSSCSLLAANTSRQECCCTLGEGWGLGCRYLACPPANSADFLSLCPSGRGYVTSGEADFSYTDVDECKRFHPQVCKNGVCVNNIPGYNCYCSSGFVYSVALLECVDLDECEQESCEGGSCVNTLGSYYCSCSPPLVLDDTQRKCVNASHLTPDENLSVCWQTVSAELMCQSPLLGAQVTFSDCCCLYGQGWGMECALCPQTDSDDFGSLCSSFPAVVFPDPEALGPGRGGGPPFFPPFSSDAFPPDALAATDYDDYTPGGGGGFAFPGGAPPADAYPGPRHFDEAYYPGRPYEDSPAFGVGRQSPPSPGESPLNLAPLPQGSPFDEDLEGDSWGPGPPPPPRRLYERRYDAYAGLSAADDCGIVDGCRNGTCIRLDEGYTCDCYHGYRLDATTMTCIDVNECLGGVDVDFPCINSRCVNTDGSFRCVCRRGYVMSRRLNHCVPA
ncbi:latent-transforming growth factor beta-binding protein 4 isoform X1 [Hippocampus comes]|uniref:latent-transforming growth factor beta-binding protein 4 isoform X1 n=1 Tax=Hippocampus comes TaxID=109280 RepID=UPI00094F0806|nr:PREDICTED: latent-transforming growth factor beta-binding protein 4-like isoform X1 [Hippocampus comes]